MDKRIIINADDFGLSDSVNKAVAQAHTTGILTSATILANMPAAKNAVKIAKQLPTLGVGVHLNLSMGKPISTDNSIKLLLNKNGELGLTPLKLMLLSFLNNELRTAIRAELTSQIQWVIDNGLTPTHLDSHKHIHTFPAIFQIVCDLAKKFHIPAVRFTYEPKQIYRPPWPLTTQDGRKQASKFRTLAKLNRIQNANLLKTDALLGIAHSCKLNVNFFRAVALYTPVKTAEVMTHPAVVAPLSSVEDRKGGHHQNADLDSLCSEKTKQFFSDAKIKLLHFGQL